MISGGKCHSSDIYVDRYDVRYTASGISWFGPTRPKMTAMYMLGAFGAPITPSQGKPWKRRAEAMEKPPGRALLEEQKLSVTFGGDARFGFGGRKKAQPWPVSRAHATIPQQGARGLPDAPIYLRECERPRKQAQMPGRETCLAPAAARTRMRTHGCARAQRPASGGGPVAAPRGAGVALSSPTLTPFAVATGAMSSAL